MSHQYSRRKIIQLSSSFIAGIAGNTILNDSSFGESNHRKIFNIQEQRNPLKKQVSANTKHTFYTKGRHLYHPNGMKVILRGINLPLLDDWGFPQKDTLAELVKTGANAVRIQWYQNYGQTRPAYSTADLDNFLFKCRANSIIPIICLWDLTCKDDPNLLDGLMSWWTSNDVVAMLRKHQSYLIINLANELGNYRWINSDNIALNNFKNSYKRAIYKFRQAGLKIPIMIDAPDCGSSIEVFPKIGQELINTDPARNLLFSGHAYWAAYNGIPQIQAVIDANIPLLFGEIANKQTEGNDPNTQCTYDLDGKSDARPAQNGFTYKNLLLLLKEKEIGWLAWSWWKDSCSKRQITNDGTFANLTLYGKDIVNNSIYGLKATAIKIRN
jgi:mannan endo-1,4-beta-mannosidase